MHGPAVLTSVLAGARQLGSEGRIGYVVKRFPRLSETFILNEILELERQGQSIDIFALLDPGENVRHGALDQLRAHVTYLPEDGWIETCRTRQGHYGQGIVETWPWRATGSGQSQARASLPFKAAAVAVLARSRGIRHLHAHFASDATTVAMLASRLGEIPYSFTAHAKDIYHDQVEAELLEDKIRGAAFVVTVCEHNRRHLANLAKDAADKIIPIYNGVDLRFFQADTSARSERNLILAVGRLVEKKGFCHLVEACRILRDQGAAFECDIVGQGELGDELARQIRQANLQDTVRLVGPRPQEELRACYRAAALLAVPSIVARDGNRDALPTVMLEAMACGLAVIATRVTGIPEIVDHGHTGFVVQPGDPRDLAAAIGRLLQDPDLRSRLGAAGRARAETRFDLRTNVGRLRQLLSERAARSEVA